MSFTKLIKWSQKSFSHLPWRRNRSLYTTLVSEIMLQQTTVGAVLNKYPLFIEKFPNLESLAKASEEELAIAWKGLGYYRRARNLKRAAEELILSFKGVFPQTRDVLTTISGVGEYTANALIGIGMNERALAIDANLERVLARFYGIQAENILKLKKEIYRLFSEKKILKNMAKIGPQAVNEALMDLGRTLCQARKTECPDCPLKGACHAYKTDTVLDFPPKSTKAKRENTLTLARFVIVKNNSIYLYQKPKEKWQEGQWELPTFIEKSNEKLNQYPYIEKLPKKKLFSMKSSITHHKITNNVYQLTLKEAQKYKGLPKGRYISLREIQKKNVTTFGIKVVKKISSQ